MKIIPREVGEKVLSHVAMGPNGCHLSRHSTAKPPRLPYAQVTWVKGPRQRYNVVAHRAAWTAVHGPIPEGMTVDHLCRTPRCVRVDHLRLLSRSENSRRNHGHDYPAGWSCSRGHDPSYRQPRFGGRTGTHCTACLSENQKAQRRRRNQT
jgi:hypothetical protein